MDTVKKHEVSEHLQTIVTHSTRLLSLLHDDQSTGGALLSYAASIKSNAEDVESIVQETNKQEASSQAA